MRPRLPHMANMSLLPEIDSAGTLQLFHKYGKLVTSPRDVTGSYRPCALSPSHMTGENRKSSAHGRPFTDILPL